MRWRWLAIALLAMALAVGLFLHRASEEARSARAAPAPAEHRAADAPGAGAIPTVPAAAGSASLAGARDRADAPPPADVSPPRQLRTASSAAPASPDAPTSTTAASTPAAASDAAAAEAAEARAAAARRAAEEAAAKAAHEKAAPPADAGVAVIGHVTDGTGAPIAGALVTAMAATLGRSDFPVGKPATTDAAGEFSLPHAGISDGAPHRVRAEHPRFRPREVGLPPRRPDEPATVCDIALDDGPAKSGRALLERGAPAAGASVTVIGRSGETIADRDGGFDLPVLSGGTHVVVARLAPRLAATGNVTVDGDGFPLEGPPLQLVLREEGAIDASGLEATLPGAGAAQVQLWAGARTPLGPPPFAAAQSGPDGAVHFLAVPPGHYVVSTATPSIGYLSPDPIAVDLLPGARQEVWLGHRGTALLIVTARRDSGQPAHAVFSAWGDSGGSSIVMSSTASARMEGLPADRYFVFCNDQQGGLGRDWLTLAAGEVKTLELQILKAGRLTGVLVDENARPAVGAKVTADTSQGGIERQSVVDAQGSFALEMLYPGQHVIRASLDGRTTTRVIEVGVGESKGPIGLVLGQ